MTNTRHHRKYRNRGDAFRARSETTKTTATTTLTCHDIAVIHRIHPSVTEFPRVSLAIMAPALPPAMAFQYLFQLVEVFRCQVILLGEVGNEGREHAAEDAV